MSFKRPLLVLLLGFVCLQAGATEIVVGERSTINVPHPDGYVELTPDMSPYYESMWAYVAASNNRYLTLIHESTAAAILRGDAVQVGRYMNIETEKSISRMSISAAQFGQFQNIMRTQLYELIARVQEQVPELTSAGNAALSEQFDADLAVDLGGVVPLPVHLDTSNTIASSMYMTVSATVNGEDMGSEILAATMLTLHVGDKVLFLYVYGAQSDLLWTRETASAWADSIVAENAFPAD